MEGKFDSKKIVLIISLCMFMIFASVLGAVLLRIV